MQIHYLSNKEEAIENTIVCVIDVISAFTTAAYIFEFGAKEIIIPETDNKALELKTDYSDIVLIGESNNEKIQGFDFGNSVLEFLNFDFRNRKVALKTSSGTKGLWNNKKASIIVAASFVNAKATAIFLKEQFKKDDCNSISFVITNNYKSAEDVALASYLCEMLFNDVDTNPIPYTEIVDNSLYGNLSTICGIREEMAYIVDSNKFNFIMLFSKNEEGIYSLKKHNLNF